MMWAAGFAGMIPGDSNFTREWKAVAKQSPDEFLSAQKSFIDREAFDVTTDTLLSNFGIDFRDSSTTIQNVIYSRAVQLGNKSNAFANVITKTNSDLPNYNPYSFEWEDKFITNFYAESSRQSSKGVLVYFTRSPSLKNGLIRRFNNEATLAHSWLKKEWGK